LAFRARATVADVDVAAATRFAGNPDTISGRLSGRLDCSGRASDAADIASTIRGTARGDIVDGVVKNLGLLRTIVVATSMRRAARDRRRSHRGAARRHRHRRPDQTRDPQRGGRRSGEAVDQRLGQEGTAGSAEAVVVPASPPFLLQPRFMRAVYYVFGLSVIGDRLTRFPVPLSSWPSAKFAACRARIDAIVTPPGNPVTLPQRNIMNLPTPAPTPPTRRP